MSCCLILENIEIIIVALETKLFSFKKGKVHQQIDIDYQYMQENISGYHPKISCIEEISDGFLIGFDDLPLIQKYSIDIHH